jgi:hypothetical protein
MTPDFAFGAGPESLASRLPTCPSAPTSREMPLMLLERELAFRCQERIRPFSVPVKEPPPVPAVPLGDGTSEASSRNAVRLAVAAAELGVVAGVGVDGEMVDETWEECEACET